MINSALAYAAMGWKCFPLRPRDKAPLIGKDQGGNGCIDATTDIEQIEMWWHQWPDANIGLLTGDKFFVLDVDPKHDGTATLEALEAKHGKLPDTVQQITGSGGTHYLFSLPDFEVKGTTGKIGRGLDIRGHHNYIVAAPSIHENGNVYTWDGMARLADQKILPAPAWLLALIRGDDKPFSFAAPIAYKLAHGTQHMALVSAAGTMRRAGFNADEIYAALKLMNEKRCEIPGPDANIRRIADSFTQYEPAKPILPVDVVRVAEKTRERPAVEDEIDDWDETPLPRTEDDEHANYLAHVIMKEHCYVSSAKELYEFNGSYWVEIEPDSIKRHALAKDNGVESTDKRRSEVVKYITAIRYRADIKWNNIGVSEIPFLDGVLDIATGMVHAHKRSNFLETVIPHKMPERGVKYACDAWLSCLGRYFDSDEDAQLKINAIQEFMGYCLLTGHARYKKALLLKGNTDCGKSTIPMAAGWLVGEHNCCAVSIEDMEDQKKIAPIVGKLVNRLGELRSSAVVADGGFKKLVSTGDPVTIEKKYVNARQYTPVAKHIIATNNLPRINDRSDATFRRLLLIKFNRAIPKAEQTTDIYDRIQEQMPGLVSWAVDGARRLYGNRGEFTDIPESQGALATYKRAENMILEFMDDSCVADPNGCIPRNDFHARLLDYGYEKNKSVSMMTRELGSLDVKVIPKYDKSSRLTVRSVIGYRWIIESDHDAVARIKQQRLAVN